MAIEGCRALVLLHDAQGHPLLATTHRGDQHLTIGLPQILARYAAATRKSRSFVMPCAFQALLAPAQIAVILAKVRR